jgi:hypothetical protein
MSAVSPVVSWDPQRDPKRVRGLLAEARITHGQFARVAGLNRIYLGSILTGRITPGELARIKLTYAMAALGLDSEAQRGE